MPYYHHWAEICRCRCENANQSYLRYRRRAPWSAAPEADPEPARWGRRSRIWTDARTRTAVFPVGSTESGSAAPRRTTRRPTATTTTCCSRESLLRQVLEFWQSRLSGKCQCKTIHRGRALRFRTVDVEEKLIIPVTETTPRRRPPSFPRPRPTPETAATSGGTWQGYSRLQGPLWRRHADVIGALIIPRITYCRSTTPLT